MNIRRVLCFGDSNTYGANPSGPRFDETERWPMLLQAYLGDLNRVKRCVKILGFVAGDDHFTEQAKVINGASEVFIAAFGEEGRHARSAIGTNSLPLGLTVEVESIFEIE